MRFISTLKTLLCGILIVGTQVNAATPTPAQLAISTYLGGINFASGGAETGVPVPGEPQTSGSAIITTFTNAGGALPWNLNDELNAADKFYKQTPFHPQALYTIWIGANDYLAGNQDPRTTATAIVNAVQRIITSYKAVNLLVGLLPDISLAPANNKLPVAVKAQITQMITAHNSLVQGGVQQLVTSINGNTAQTTKIKVAFLNADATLKNAIANAKKLGYTNVIDACFNQQTGVVCVNPNQYLFWDGVHPSCKGHSALATDALASLKAAGITSVPQWFLFGDSLSDPGNNYLTGLTFSPQIKFPPKPYWYGHYSNGITWAEQLTLKLFLLQTPVAVTLAIPGVKALASWKSGINFASGGATSGAVYGAPGPKQSSPADVLAAYRAQGALLPWSLPDELIKADELYKQTPFHPQALYVLWIGANDYFTGNQDPRLTAAAIVSSIQKMVTSYQGRQFLVGLLPDFASLPGNVGKSAQEKAVFTQLSQGHNALVQGGVQQLQATLKASGINIRVAFIDAFTTLQKAIADPAKYGLTDVTTPCFDVTTGSLCTNPDQKLFWDQVHPTYVGHKQLAVDAFAAMKTAGIINVPQMIVFGDSLVDNGNNYIVGQSLPQPIAFPPSPYYDGRYTNGPAFAEQLQILLSAQDTSFLDEVTPVANYITGQTTVKVYAADGVSLADTEDLTAPDASSSTSSSNNTTMIIIAAVVASLGTAILIGSIMYLMSIRTRQASTLKKVSRVEGQVETFQSNPALQMASAANMV